MKKKSILVVDALRLSSKKNITSVVTVHTRMAYILSQFFDCDFVLSWEHSFKQERIKDKTYDVVIFVYASGYCELPFMLKFFAEHNKDAKYFFVLNEYDLTENPVLRELGKQYGIKYSVMSNYYSEDDDIFRSCKQRINDIHVMNLNTLIYEGVVKDDRTKGFFSEYKNENKIPILYYGTFRPDRIIYFKKYFDGAFHVSTSSKNTEKYTQAGINCKFVPPLKWSGHEQRLFDVKSSLYIEDVFTHTNYNYLANRFYEGLMYNVPIFFDKSCMNTIEKSGYPVDDYFIVDSKKELMKKVAEIDNYVYPKSFHSRAAKEREVVMSKIKQLVLGV